jgi:hypothetical protein
VRGHGAEPRRGPPIAEIDAPWHVTTQIQPTRSHSRPGRAHVVGSVVANGLPLGGATFLFLRELALHGALCHTAGMLPMVCHAQARL